MGVMPSGAATAGRASPPEERRVSADTITGWLFSAPAVIFIAAFIVVPFILAFYFSFTN